MSEGTDRPDESEHTTYQLRLPRSLRDEFIKAAKQNNLSAASLVKDFMRDYVRSPHSKSAPWGRDVL